MILLKVMVIKLQYSILIFNNIQKGGATHTSISDSDSDSFSDCAFS